MIGLDSGSYAMPIYGSTMTHLAASHIPIGGMKNVIRTLSWYE